jgi:hypothetical protein
MTAIAVAFALSLTACGKDKDEGLDIGRLLDLPYSQLTPTQQKAKLEQESINLLRELNALSSSPAIEAIEHLGELFNISEPNIPDPIREVGNWKEIFDLTRVTGEFTWNASRNQWTQRTSNDLRFIFPSTKGGRTNDAMLIVRTENSGRTFTEKWREIRCSWTRCDTIDHELEIFLPRSSTAILNINDREAAKIEFGADYSNNDAPERATYKMTTSDGYELSWTANVRGNEKVTMTVIRNGNRLIEAEARTNSKLDEILDLLIDEMNGNDVDIDDVYRRLAKADASIRMMGDLVVVYTIDDPEGYSREMDAIWKWYDSRWEQINWDSRTYYTDYGQLRRELAIEEAKALNNFMRSALVSYKDNFKIADLVARAEKTGEYWAPVRWNSQWNQWEWGGRWNEQTQRWEEFPDVKLYDYYGIVLYLKFNDNTYVEAEVYFGSGFNALESEWRNFIDAFSR